MSNFFSICNVFSAHPCRMQCMNPKCIQINLSDSVCMALENLKKGGIISIKSGSIKLKEDIPAGHKIAVSDIQKGTDILKYGTPIGSAKQEIQAGEWVHTHNMSTNLEGLLKYQYSPIDSNTKASPNSVKSFNGYLRRNGEAGIRNEIWIIAVTACVNGTVRILEKKASRLNGIEDIDGIFSYGHPYGCSQTGMDLERSRKLISSLAKHPNAGAVLIMGLGCENISMESMKESLGEYDPERIKFLIAQDCENEIQTGLRLLEELLDKCLNDRRSTLPLSMLRIGLKCGGSDGFSGITANPLVGAVSDLFIRAGASSIMTEIPEMFGAEHILFNRCINKAVFSKAVKMLNGFKKYFLSHGQTIHENPSPGNIEGGITTLEEKSLGCILKGGSSPVVDILEIGEQSDKFGLSLLNGPGNDPVSVSVLTASHVHMILFTTGRGTPFGGPVPTLKISSNNQLADNKPAWIDYNAGKILHNGDLDICAAELFDLSVQIASGEKYTSNEQNGYREFHIFKTGLFQPLPEPQQTDG